MKWFGWLVLYCLKPLPTIFQLYRGGQFYWWICGRASRSSKQLNQYIYMSFHIRGHRGRDRIVDGFTTTYVISAYHD
jgi:hypothetical protein